MAETAEHIDLDSPLQCWNTIEYDDRVSIISLNLLKLYTQKWPSQNIIRKLTKTDITFHLLKWRCKTSNIEC